MTNLTLTTTAPSSLILVGLPHDAIGSISLFLSPSENVRLLMTCRMLSKDPGYKKSIEAGLQMKVSGEMTQLLSCIKTSDVVLRLFKMDIGNIIAGIELKNVTQTKGHLIVVLQRLILTLSDEEFEPSEALFLSASNRLLNYFENSCSHILPTCKAFHQAEDFNEICSIIDDLAEQERFLEGTELIYHMLDECFSYPILDYAAKSDLECVIGSCLLKFSKSLLVKGFFQEAAQIATITPECNHKRMAFTQILDQLLIEERFFDLVKIINVLSSDVETTAVIVMSDKIRMKYSFNQAVDIFIKIIHELSNKKYRLHAVGCMTQFLIKSHLDDVTGIVERLPAEFREDVLAAVRKKEE